MSTHPLAAGLLSALMLAGCATDPGVRLLSVDSDPAELVRIAEHGWAVERGTVVQNPALPEDAFAKLVEDPEPWIYIGALETTRTPRPRVKEIMSMPKGDRAYVSDLSARFDSALYYDTLKAITDAHPGVVIRFEMSGRSASTEPLADYPEFAKIFPTETITNQSLRATLKLALAHYTTSFQIFRRDADTGNWHQIGAPLTESAVSPKDLAGLDTASGIDQTLVRVDLADLRKKVLARLDRP